MIKVKEEIFKVVLEVFKLLKQYSWSIIFVLAALTIAGALWFNLFDANILTISKYKIGKKDSQIEISKKGTVYFPTLDSSIIVQLDDDKKPTSVELSSPEYIQINGKTQNIFKIQDNSDYRVRFNNAEIIISKDSLDKIYNDKEFTYLSLYDYSHCNENLNGSKTIIAREKSKNIYKPVNSYSIILLDTSISFNDTPINLNFPISDTDKNVSLQLFQSYRKLSYTDSVKNKYTFSLGDSFSVRNTVRAKYTEWGASKITITKGGWISFDKPIINRILADKSNIDSISIKQLNESTYLNSEYYVPSFSNLSLNLTSPNDQVVFDFTYYNPYFWFGSIILGFIFLYLLVKFFYLRIYKFSRLLEVYDLKEGYGEYAEYLKRFNIIFILLLFFGLFRILIGYKLNFTAPYYDNYFYTSIANSVLITIAWLQLCYLFLWLNNIKIFIEQDFSNPFKYLLGISLIGVLVCCCLWKFCYFDSFLNIYNIKNLSKSNFLNFNQTFIVLILCIQIVIFNFIPILLKITSTDFLINKWTYYGLISLLIVFIYYFDNFWIRIILSQLLICIVLIFAIINYTHNVQAFFVRLGLALSIVSLFFGSNTISTCCIGLLILYLCSFKSIIDLLKEIFFPILIFFQLVWIHLQLDILFQKRKSNRFNFISDIKSKLFKCFKYINEILSSKFLSKAIYKTVCTLINVIYKIISKKRIIEIIIGIIILCLLKFLYCKEISYKWFTLFVLTIYSILNLYSHLHLKHDSDKFNHNQITKPGYRKKRVIYIMVQSINKFIENLFWIGLGFGSLAILPFLNKDSGYFINLLIPAISIMCLIFFSQLYTYKSDGDYPYSEYTIKNKFTKYRFVLTIGLFCILVIFSSLFVKSIKYEPTERFESRITAFYDFAKVQEDGTSLAEEQSQFFAVLAKNVSDSVGGYNDEGFHKMHSGFNAGVMHNDLSFPSCILAGIPNWYRAVFILLYLIILGLIHIYCIYTVLKPSNSYISNALPHLDLKLTKSGIVRIIASGILFSNAFWLILSYYGYLPFTGRLMYGMGQDSIGEVLDTILLSALIMIYIIPLKDKLTNDNE